MHSGRPLTAKVLGHHLGVDRDTATRLAKAQGLKLEWAAYPWRRIWQQIHGIEGSHLAARLDMLKARHPNSAIIGGIEDLEAALRTPMVKFPGMAALLGMHPDTLRKQVKRGRKLPFPVLDLGLRMQLYRPLDVILWRDEELLIDLPSAIHVAPKPVSQPGQEEDRVEPKPKTKATAKAQPHMPPADRKKAIFGGAARSKRKPAG
ncbi:hypothetical protein SAMN04488523_1242 [Sulfitobacter brevis]|uniref:Uncharacterized protein n=1 Tax=Sulfitobacter brevis TaxID=74348 RepID=A0A1I2GFV1_9RHOB|nr:hypothetical protein [Sulfitobacter brevis]SFF16382.1 hypothetical protein SAMN04488523_1242 [Sulfitobacter brevis]